MNRRQATASRLTDEQLGDIVDRLARALSPRRIILFGSHVYGEPHADSDIDLLVLVSDEELTREDQDSRGYRCLRGLFLPIELHFRGEREFEQYATAPRSFEHEVILKGRVVYAA